MKFKKYLLVLISILLIATTSGCTLFGGGSSGNDNNPSVTLTIWRLFDDEEVFKPIIDSYIAERSDQYNITIKYEKKDYADYEDNFINAIAAKKGPDILMLRNDWIPKHYDKLITAPKSVITIDQYKTRFPDVVVNQNTTKKGNIYGLPLSLDTLVLFYNKDIFDQKYNENIIAEKESYANKYYANPPWNWTDLLTINKELTQKNGKEIKRAGIALGLASNVDRAEDILSVLMLQNGAKMVADDSQSSTFNLSTTKDSGELYYPGTKALEFYTSFANQSSENYCWDNSMPNSVDAFMQGKTAMLIDYPFTAQKFKEKKPNLNFGIGPLPQISGAEKAVDYTSYWVEAVTNNSQHSELAWDFINYISTQGNGDYLSSTGRTGVTKLEASEIPLVKSRLEAGSPSSFQQATAQTWFKGYYANSVDQIMKDLIDNVAQKGQNPQNAIDKAASDVTTLLKKKPY